MVIGLLAGARGLSYAPGGSWVDIKGTEDDYICTEHFQCVLGHKSWKAKGARFFKARDACEALASRGIQSIYFFGDSFMRQIYAATLVSLNGNYKNGTLHDDVDGDRIGCSFREQFNEKRCGVHQLNRDGRVCGGKVHLHFMQQDMMNVDVCPKARDSLPGSAVVLFSQGNHHLVTGSGGRVGINNPKLHAETYEKLFCPRLRAYATSTEKQTDDLKACSFWWMSTHQRIIGWFDDEKPAVIEKFNRDMRSFFDSGKCGEFNYIDVFNMTQALVSEFHLDATSEQNKRNSLSVSYDYVHFGMEVNLMKAQALINALMEFYPVKR
jgi:hypothetical protein